MTLESGFAMIIKSREMCDKLNTRKCRNWQTSKTKDLVAIAVVWVQVPSSALICGCDKYSRNAVFIVFFVFWCVTKKAKRSLCGNSILPFNFLCHSVVSDYNIASFEDNARGNKSTIF